MRLNRVAVVSVLAALVAVCVGGAFSPARAQSSFFPRKVRLSWQRMNTASDNPNATALLPYSLELANGNHNAGNAGVAVAVEDTSQAIDVRDHFLNSIGAFKVTPSVLSLSDSSWWGDLLLTANSSTIDTVTYFRDISIDGVTWVVADSLQGHIVSDRLALTLGAVSDSGRVALASVSNAGGAVSTAAGIRFSAISGMGRAGVTSLAQQGIAFVRFRIHMTAGDFAAAGSTRGVSGEFIYPAADLNVNQPQRAQR